MLDSRFTLVRMQKTPDQWELFPEPEDPKADGGPKSPIGDLSFLGSRRVLQKRDPEAFASNPDNGGCTQVPEVGNSIFFWYQDFNGEMHQIFGTICQKNYGKKGWTFWVELSQKDRNKHGIKQCHLLLNEKQDHIIGITVS